MITFKRRDLLGRIGGIISPKDLRQLDALVITVDILEAQRHLHRRHQIRARLAHAGKLGRGADEALLAPELAERGAPDTLDDVLQRRIADALHDLLDILVLLAAVDAVLLDDQVGRLAQAGADGLADGRVGHGLVHVLLAAVVAVVGRGRVARVDGEELALDVWAEIVDVVHASDVGLGQAGKRFRLNAPLVELFDLDVHARVGLLVRHDAVDGAVGEAGSVVDVRLCVVVERLGDEALERVGGHDGVLARNHNGRLLLLAAVEALGDDGGDELEDFRADGAGDDVGGADFVDDLAFVVLRVDGAVVVDLERVFSVWADLGDGVFLGFLECLDKAIHHVDEDDLIVGLVVSVSR